MKNQNDFGYMRKINQQVGYANNMMKTALAEATRLLDQIPEGEKRELFRGFIERAKAGDLTAPEFIEAMKKLNN